VQRIGNYQVAHLGGRWIVTKGNHLVSEHYGKWAAIQKARRLNWYDVHEKKRPPVTSGTGGSEEPKSKWRGPYNGGTHG